MHGGAQAQIQLSQSSRSINCPSIASPNWRQPSIRSSAPEFSIILRTPMRDSPALRDVLKPDGAMHLMVYAPYGRTGIYMLQEFCRRVGIRATDEGTRDLISALRALPPGHPLETVLRHAPDIQQEAALADALLHPHDRAYSVPQLLDFIDRGGLTFWPMGKTSALFPSMWCDDASPSSLPNGRALPGRAIRCCGAFSRHDGPP